MLGMRLAVMHNLYFYNTLMEKIRASIEEGSFDRFYEENFVKLDARI
jgi:queuine tRNA-ribosyltransferase